MSQAISAADATETPLSVTPVLDRQAPLPSPPAWAMVPAAGNHVRCPARLERAAALLALPYPKGFYSALFVFLSLAEGLSNLIPFQTRLAVSDGGRLSMLWRGGPGGERFMALLRMQGALARGASAGTLAADDLAKGAALRDDSPDTAAAHVIAWAAAYGLRQDQEAAELLDVALRHSGRCEPAMRLALISDAGVFQARRRGRVDLAEAWLAALPTQLPMPWLRGRIEIALLEARGDVAGARERLEERERDLLKMPDPVQRELLLAHLRNWQSELLEREKAGSR